MPQSIMHDNTNKSFEQHLKKLQVALKQVQPPTGSLSKEKIKFYEDVQKSIDELKKLSSEFSEFKPKNIDPLEISKNVVNKVFNTKNLKNVEKYIDEGEEIIKKHPWQCVVAGVLIGLILGKL